MDVARARYLVSERGRGALEALDPELGRLEANALSLALRRRHPATEAAALAEQVTLQAGAAKRFSASPLALYSAPGLEMTTHPLVAARRAKRLASIGAPIADLTCGLGGDLYACTGLHPVCVGIERDTATALLAAVNVAPAAVVRADALHAPLALKKFAVIIDPERRSAARRHFDPGAFSPPWDAALRLATEARAAVVKAPPGLRPEHIPADAEVEHVQFGRSMREAAIWLGDGASPGLRRAVLLPSGATLDSAAPEAAPGCIAPGAFVFDPESCVTLAGLVRQLAFRLCARMMDPQVAYLTAPAVSFDPLCATFEVLDALPFSVSRLKQRLRERRWRPDEIRRRAFPIEPDELRRLIGRLEGDPVTLLLTTLGGKRTVIVARRMNALRSARQ